MDSNLNGFAIIAGNGQASAYKSEGGQVFALLTTLFAFF
jgi:hypothetical protein